MIWLLIGYMWLYIHRPFEVWPILATIRLERVYMIGMLFAWAITGPKPIIPSRQSLAFLSMFVVMCMSYVNGPQTDESWLMVENYAKVGVFYVLALSVVRDEKTLKTLLLGFLGAMSLYMLHSLWEFKNGHHVYRMGTVRMVGVDSSNANPNAFAATVLNSLTMLIPFASKAFPKNLRLLMIPYIGMVGICVLLTGSRGGLISLVLLSVLYILFQAKARVRMLIVMAVFGVVAWMCLPENLKDRFMTIIDPSRGPANAQTSAESRSAGFYAGIDLWHRSPLVGIGPGAFGQVREDIPGLDAHNLYGQVLGELGTLGTLSLVAIVLCYFLTHWKMRKVARRGGPEVEFMKSVSTSVVIAVLMLLFQGFAGHNLYRYTWVWFGAFQTIALFVAQAKIRQLENNPLDDPLALSARQSAYPKVRVTSAMLRA